MLTKEKRILLAIVLTVVSLLSGLYGFFVKPPLELTRDSGAQNWETRMKPVKQALPTEVKTVGYVSDLDLIDNPTRENFFAEIDEFSLTAYSMIPRMVRQGLNYEWIIGNFNKPEFRKYLDKNLPSGYELRDMGFGIYLIHVNTP